MESVRETTSTFLAALTLVIVHVLAGRLRFLDYIPRSRWLSFSGGIPVAFVFLVILPTLAREQPRLEEAVGPLLGFAGKHVYVVALVGLVTFYAVERVVKESKWRRERRGMEEAAGDAAFWVAIATFGTMNLVIGYVLAEEARTLVTLALFTAAFAAKFLIQDRGLHEDHRARYDRYGRWIVIAAVLAGWGAGTLTDVPLAGLAALKAFIMGAVIMNVMKEELPQERESRIWAFVLGAGLYSVLLLAL